MQPAPMKIPLPSFADDEMCAVGCIALTNFRLYLLISSEYFFLASWSPIAMKAESILCCLIKEGSIEISQKL